jgi:hypothetical protein
MNGSKWQNCMGLVEKYVQQNSNECIHMETDLTWGCLQVTVVEPQLILLPIGPFLKVVETPLLVLRLHTNSTMQCISYRLTQALSQTHVPVQMPQHFLLEWTFLDTQSVSTTWTAYTLVASSDSHVRSGLQCPDPEERTKFCLFFWMLKI